MTNLIGLTIASTAMALSLAACSSQPVTNTAAPATESKAAHGGEYQKPGAAIRFQVENGGALSAGEIRTVKVTVFNEYDGGDVTITVGETPGVRILSDIRDHKFSMAGNASHSFDVQLSAGQDGVYSIPLIATADLGNGHTMMRSGGLSLRVGEQANLKRMILSESETDSEVLTEADVSGGVVAMEAEETIRTED